MSVNRSSSGVRSLAAMFENQDPSSSPDVRGRSPNGHLSSSANGDRPLSKVRASFVAVEPSNAPVPDQIDPDKSKAENEQRQEPRESTASFRRQSFSLDDSQDSFAIAALKKTISGEEERRASNPFIHETIPEAAIEQTPVETPAVEAKDYMAAGDLAESSKDAEMEAAGSKLKGMTLADDNDNNDGDNAAPQDGTAQSGSVEPPPPTQDLPVEDPDKPVSAAQEEPGSLKPSDPNEAATISAAVTATPAKASTATPAKSAKARRGTIDPETLQVPVPTPARKHRPSVISTDSPKSAPGSTPAASQPKTPMSAKKPDAPSKASPTAQRSVTSPKGVSRKLSRSSLAASTAPAAAKSKPQAPSSPDTKATKSKTNPVSKTRPKSPTRPIKVSSHLTAPTASSAARKEAPSANNKPAAPPPRAPTTSRPQPGSSKSTTKPAPRTSLARPSSAAKKPEPRTASRAAPDEGFLARMMRPTASSTSKVHEKTEVKSPPRRRPSVIKSEVKTKPKVAKTEKPHTNGTADASVVEDTKEDAATAGASTPQGEAVGQNGDAALEATPAFDSATIR
ncbi:hypothetical protein MBLNU459_g5893t1 [Dothideomycetes sp. NU459]